MRSLRCYFFHLLQKIRNRNPLKLILEIIWPDIRSPNFFIPAKEVNETLEKLEYLGKTVELESEIADKVGISPEELIIHRDLAAADPRRETRYPDVGTNIRSAHREVASQNIMHYHNWLEAVQEDWKDRWSIRIYSDKAEKSGEILDALSEEIH